MTKGKITKAYLDSHLSRQGNTYDFSAKGVAGAMTYIVKHGTALTRTKTLCETKDYFTARGVFEAAKRTDP